METEKKGQSGRLSRTRVRRAQRWAIGVGVLALSGAALAQTNPYAKGPDPTSALLNATSGPFAIGSSSVLLSMAR